jgi:hypothetical protein
VEALKIEQPWRVCQADSAGDGVGRMVFPAERNYDGEAVTCTTKHGHSVNFRPPFVGGVCARPVGLVWCTRVTDSEFVTLVSPVNITQIFLKDCDLELLPHRRFHGFELLLESDPIVLAGAGNVPGAGR